MSTLEATNKYDGIVLIHKVRRQPWVMRHREGNLYSANDIETDKVLVNSYYESQIEYNIEVGTWIVVEK